MRCKECKIKVDCCDTPDCVNGNHASDSWEAGEEIFHDGENGFHYCDKDCLLEEMKQHHPAFAQGVVTEIEEAS